MDSKEIAVVRDFIAAINQGNASQLSSLMTEDHTFVDSRGTTDSGRDNMTKGWDEYFRMFPDYRIEVQSILQDGDLVASLRVSVRNLQREAGACPGKQNRNAGRVEGYSGKRKNQSLAGLCRLVRRMQNNR